MIYFFRSVLLACFDNEKNMLKLRQNQQNFDIKNAEFHQRIKLDQAALQDEEECNYFISLDSVDFDDLGNDNLNYNGYSIMVSDVRDHALASNCLPEGVSGYWIRIFGPKSKHMLYISLWKRVNNSAAKKQAKDKTKPVTDELMKIGELSVELFNDGSLEKVRKKKKKKNTLMSKGIFCKQNIEASDFTPTFCCKEKYTQIHTICNECTENGNHELFSEMFDKFSKNLKSDIASDIETKLLLLCEKSLYSSIKGDFPEAKRILQSVVDNVVPKSQNKNFLLNRAYLYLATTHIIEGNYGTAEECLNVLQKDRKNGIPYEDLLTFYMLFGIVLMNFARKLPKMSKALLRESYTWLEKALALIEKHDLVMTFLYKYHHLHLSFVQYYIISDTMNKENPVTDYALENIAIHLAIVERNFHLLSKRLKSLFLIIKGQVYIIEKKISEGLLLVKEGETIAKEMNFYEEIRLSGQIIDRFDEQGDDKVNDNDISNNGSTTTELMTTSSNVVCEEDGSSV